MSPRTVAARERVLAEAAVEGSKEFKESNLWYPSINSNRPLDVDISLWVQLNNGYICITPKLNDKI